MLHYFLYVIIKQKYEWYMSTAIRQDYIHQIFEKQTDVAIKNMEKFKHSCGAIEPFIPLLIESGFDIINPVQCSAVGMEPIHLRTNMAITYAFGLVSIHSMYFCWEHLNK